MPRYRKITPVNVAEKERILNEKVRQNRTLHKSPVRRTRRSNTNPLLPLLQFKNNIQRSFENRSTQEVVFDTCKNLRGICGQVRTFADDLEKLLGSVESVVPVVETVLASYSSSFKNKPQLTPEKEAPLEMELNLESESESENQANNETMTRDNPDNQSGKNAKKMPSETEIKEFLNNPLVAGLLQNLTQKMMTNKQ